ncbi:hypothetical protein ACFE04_005028 [Oxalis oulophora]
MGAAVKQAVSQAEEDMRSNLGANICCEAELSSLRCTVDKIDKESFIDMSLNEEIARKLELVKKIVMVFSSVPPIIDRSVLILDAPVKQNIYINVSGAISRLAILNNQHKARLRYARSDVVELLRLGQQDNALLRISSAPSISL